MSENPKVYTVCTVQVVNGEYEGARLVGLFTEQAAAVARIECNACDIYEGGYRYAVVEMVRLNVLYPASTEEPVLWYEWQGDKESGGYKSVPCPKQLQRMCGFGL